MSWSNYRGSSELLLLITGFPEVEKTKEAAAHLRVKVREQTANKARTRSVQHHVES